MSARQSGHVHAPTCEPFNQCICKRSNQAMWTLQSQHVNPSNTACKPFDQGMQTLQLRILFLIEVFYFLILFLSIITSVNLPSKWCMWIIQSGHMYASIRTCKLSNLPHGFIHVPQHTFSISFIWTFYLSIHGATRFYKHSLIVFSVFDSGKSYFVEPLKSRVSYAGLPCESEFLTFFAWYDSPIYRIRFIVWTQLEYTGMILPCPNLVVHTRFPAFWGSVFWTNLEQLFRWVLTRP